MKIYSNSSLDRDQKLQLLQEITYQEVWVKIKHVVSSNYCNYVKVCDMYTYDNPIIHVRRLPTWWTPCVDKGPEEIDDNDYAKISSILDGELGGHAFYISDFDIPDPVELLTTEEMRDILNACTIVYE